MECRKALSACVCAQLQPFVAPVPVHFWVHPREPDRVRSTSWLAHKLVANSSYTVEGCGAMPGAQCALLFPSPDARPWNEVEFSDVVLVDGTWDECRSMILRSPHLQAMPKITLQSCYTGAYQVRRAPWTGALCTAEAVGRLYTEMGVEKGERLLDLVEFLNLREAGYKLKT